MVDKHDAILLAASREGTGRGQHLRTSHVRVFVSEKPSGDASWACTPPAAHS